MNKRVTLWLTAEAAEQLDRICKRDRLSYRVALQSALECIHLFGLSPERRAAVLVDCVAPDLERAVALAWQVALEQTRRRRDVGKREKKVVPYPEELEELLRGLLAPDVSLSSAVSAVFISWPGQDDAIREAKRCVWRWALPRAYARADARRLGEPDHPPLGDGLLAVS